MNELTEILESIKRLEKNNHFVKVSRMKLMPKYSKSIRAYFIASIGTISMRNWKLIESNETYRVEPPCETFINKNGVKQTEPLIEIFDKTIIDKVFNFAMSEYKIQLKMNNEVQYANSIK